MFISEHVAQSIVNGIDIDSIYAYDKRRFETAIKRNSNPWIIVETADTREEIFVKHQKWIDICKENPPEMAFDVDLEQNVELGL